MKNIFFTFMFFVFSLKSYCQSDSIFTNLLCKEWEQYKVTGTKEESKIKSSSIIFHKNGSWDEIENKKVVSQGAWNYSAKSKTLFMTIIHDDDPSDGNGGYVDEIQIIKLSKKLLVVSSAGSKKKIYSRPVKN